MHITVFKIFSPCSAFSFSLQSPPSKCPDSFHKQSSTNLSGEADFCPDACPQLLEMLLVKGADTIHGQRQDTTQNEPKQIEQSLLYFPGTDSQLSKLSYAACSRAGRWLWHKHLPSNLIPLKPSSLEYPEKCYEAQQEPQEERSLNIRPCQPPTQRLNTLRNFVTLRS